MITITLQVPSMHCSHCTQKIQTFVSEVQGVQDIHFDLDSKSLTVSFVPPATKEAIIEAIEDCGFEAR
ncbi:heavy-metal-associated domain-containing protein [Helicobacter kayseriensis]|uniref:heavy-metal-associated domain-containing protein n=1 Tax=Helicobacter kayseriensis TaxID=2905877 RepID=UPI001E36B57A|nr:heavy metal-associated domain-containing protein [Helicobacter kayseriensis]MCE3047675.1 heavy-metal-associated domain-containing protein [Helicobacter kayseriensis]MCE3049087.1 heavy-metal-associated domain-containing protein [Helicobacter kayseriensis]